MFQDKTSGYNVMVISEESSLEVERLVAAET